MNKTTIKNAIKLHKNELMVLAKKNSFRLRNNQVLSRSKSEIEIINDLKSILGAFLITKKNPTIDDLILDLACYCPEGCEISEQKNCIKVVKY